MRALRFGVIGWGYWGPKIARNLEALPEAHVTWIADLDPSRLGSALRDHPQARTTSRVEDVMASEVDVLSWRRPYERTMPWRAPH